MEEWEKMINKITERKELTETLRKYGFNATADEYLEMVGALKLYFQSQIDKAREEAYKTGYKEGWSDSVIDGKQLKAKYIKEKQNEQ